MQGPENEYTNSELEVVNANNHKPLPQWLSNIIVQLKNSQLTFSIDHLNQLNISDSLRNLIIDIIHCADKDKYPPPDSQFWEKVGNLRPNEIHEINTVVDIDLASQKQKIDHQTIQNQFQFILNSTPPRIPEDTFKDSFGLPSQYHHFTGRKKKLDKLVRHLSQTSAERQRKFIISGTSGIGKTQLAVTAAYQLLKRYQDTSGKEGCQSVIWLIAGTEEGGDNQALLKDQFNILATELGLNPDALPSKELIKKIYQKLAEKHSPFLVVFDNANNFRDINAFLPPVNVPLIITTRTNDENDFNQTFKFMPLTIFKKRDALSYIRTVLRQNHPKLFNKKDAKSLAKILGRFPLALTQALSYITKTNTPIKKYLRDFNQQKEKYFKNSLAKGDSYQEEKEDPVNATVWAVIELSLKNVTHADAHKILKACAYLAPEAPIDRALLANWSSGIDNCQNAIDALRRYSLLENAPLPNHVRIHKLVQEILLLDHNDEPAQLFLDMIANFVAQHYEQEENPLDDEARQKSLLPHLQAVLDHMEKLTNPTESIRAKIAAFQFFLGTTHGQIGNLIEATYYLERALKSTESLKNYRMVPRVLVNLSNVTQESGNVEGAKVLLERALAIQNELFGQNHLETAKTLENLGTTHLLLGNASEAKAFLEQASDIFTKYSYPEDFELAELMINMAATLLELGNPMKAETLIKKGLSILKDTLGSTHPSVATALEGLGIVILELGNAEKAKIIFKKALSILENHYNSKDPSLTETLINLASALLALNNVAEAKAYLERAKLIAQPNDTHLRARIFTNLGYATFLSGDKNLAKVLLEQALEIKVSIYGTNHAEFANTAERLGIVFAEMGELDQAKTLFDEVLAIKETTYGPQHYRVATSLINLGKILLLQDKPNAATAPLERALAILAPPNSPENFQAASAHFELGKVLQALKQPTEAIAHFEQAVSIYSKNFGDQYPGALEAQAWINQLQNSDSDDRSEPFTQSSIKDLLKKLLSKLLEDSDFPPIDHIIMLARCCFETDLIKEALALLDCIPEQELNFDGWYLHAECQLWLNDFINCRKTLFHCRRLATDDDMQTRLAEISARLDKKQEKAKRKNEQYKSISSQSNLSLHDQLNLVILLIALRRFQDALGLVNTIISQNPPSEVLASAYFQQAQSYFALQRYQEAQRSCEHSVNLKENEHVRELMSSILVAIDITPKLEELHSQLLQNSMNTLTQ